MSGHSEAPKRRPDLRVFFRNLRGHQPLGERLRLILRNNWLKVRRRRDCCGNFGQPGC
jgi:hypothetical protein